MKTDKTKILKREILLRYKSVRQFAFDANIPYSTLVSALDRGIDGMGYAQVIKMCDLLRLNPVDFSRLSDSKDVGDTLIENEVMAKYFKLNELGKDKALEIMDDLAQIKKYRAK